MDDFSLGRRSAFHGLDPELLLLHGVLPGWQDGVENILSLGLSHVFLVLLAEALSGLAFVGGRDLAGGENKRRGSVQAALWRIAPAIGWWGLCQPLLGCPVQLRNII